MREEPTDDVLVADSYSAKVSHEDRQKAFNTLDRKTYCLA
jgi:hypothetical protein